MRGMRWEVRRGGQDPGKSRALEAAEGSLMTNEVNQLQWIRLLVLERQREDHDIPTWLALEWLDEAIRKSAAEPPREPDAKFNGLLTDFSVAQYKWAKGEGSRESAAAAREAVYQHVRNALNRGAER
jgi:hypothetical protein